MVDNKIKVLLADNSDVFGIPIANRLREHGLEVSLMAKDGKQVIAAVEKEQPDVLLMDFFMLELDAIGVLRALNALPQKPMAMVMLNYDNVALEWEVMKSGASYYFLMPFDIDEMAKRILSLYQKNRAAPLRERLSFPAEGLEAQVTEVIHQIGVPAHIKGYQFLRDAVLMAIDDSSILNGITKRLYPAIAQKHATTSSRVERAIRHAIEVAWGRGDADILNIYFGHAIQDERGKPTNSEFIATISDKIRLQLKIKEILSTTYLYEYIKHRRLNDMKKALVLCLSTALVLLMLAGCGKAIQSASGSNASGAMDSQGGDTSSDGGANTSDISESTDSFAATIGGSSDVASTNADTLGNTTVTQSNTAAPATSTQSQTSTTTSAHSTTSASVSQSTTSSTTAPQSGFVKPYDTTAIINYAKSYGAGIGMTWDDALTTTNCSWEAPVRTTSCHSETDMKQAIQISIDRVKHVQELNGYQPGEFHYKVYLEPIADGEFLMYFLIG